jgi:hypothetical protein
MGDVEIVRSFVALKGENRWHKFASAKNVPFCHNSPIGMVHGETPGHVVNVRLSREYTRFLLPHHQLESFLYSLNSSYSKVTQRPISMVPLAQ